LGTTVERTNKRKFWARKRTEKAELVKLTRGKPGYPLIAKEGKLANPERAKVNMTSRDTNYLSKGYADVEGKN